MLYSCYTIKRISNSFLVYIGIFSSGVQGEFLIGDMNLGHITVYMAFKITGLEEITKGAELQKRLRTES